MNDFVQSLIRTWTPGLVAYLIGLGFLPETLSQDATLTFTAIIFGVYYALVRLLEHRFPWVGFFLGSKSTPSY